MLYLFKPPIPTIGILIWLEADGLTDGTAIDINNDGTELSTGSLIKVTSKASGTDAGNNGLIKVIAVSYTHLTLPTKA